MTVKGRRHQLQGGHERSCCHADQFGKFQNSNLNDDGYDSEGNLPHFVDEPNDDMEMYFEQAIDGGSVAEAVKAPAAPNELDVMRLSVAKLHDELKKRCCGTQGKKAKLQDCLK